MVLHVVRRAPSWAYTRTRSSDCGTRSSGSDATSSVPYRILRPERVPMKRRRCASMLRPRCSGCDWKTRNESSSPCPSSRRSTAEAPNARISSSSRSASQAKKPSASRASLESPTAIPARLSALPSCRCSGASYSPARGSPMPCGPSAAAKWPTFVTPPVGTTTMRSESRSWPRRLASVCSAL